MSEIIFRFEHQEDENAPTGTRFYVSAINKTTLQVLTTKEGTSWEEAGKKVIEDIYYKGVI